MNTTAKYNAYANLCGSIDIYVVGPRN